MILNVNDAMMMMMMMIFITSCDLHFGLVLCIIPFEYWVGANYLLECDVHYYESLWILCDDGIFSDV
jgi:hypothetical protein